MKYYPAWEAEARVWEFGAKKYARMQWTKLWGEETVNVVKASALRHLTLLLDGQTHDEESGLHHAGHVLCNTTMLIRHAHLKSGEAFSKPEECVANTPGSDHADRKNTGKPDLSFLTPDAIDSDLRDTATQCTDKHSALKAAIIAVLSIQPWHTPAALMKEAAKVRGHMRQILNEG